MMPPQHKIPFGWRRLGPDEVIKIGDKLCDPDQDEEGDWFDVNSSVGSTPAKYSAKHDCSFIFIRHEPEPAPPPEREWLNPWG